MFRFLAAQADVPFDEAGIDLVLAKIVRKDFQTDRDGGLVGSILNSLSARFIVAMASSRVG